MSEMRNVIHTVLMALGSFTILFGQAPIVELEYDIEVDARITDLLLDETSESLLYVIGNWSVNDLANLTLIKYGLANGSEEMFELTELLPEAAYGVSIVELSDAKFLLGIEKANVDRIFLAGLNDQFEVGEPTYFSLAETSEDVQIFTSHLVKGDESYLLVGNFSSNGSSAVDTYAIELNSMDSLRGIRNTIIPNYLPVNDASFTEGTWIIDDSDTYVLQPGELEWEEVEYPVLNKMFRGTNIEELNDGSFVVTARQHGSIIYRNGIVIKKLSGDFEEMSVDSLFFTSDRDSVTYNSLRSISVDEMNEKVYIGGTTEVTDEIAGFESLEPSKLFIARYDNDLNRDFLFTYQAPYFYRNFDTKKVGANMIVSSGVKYSPVKERLMAYVLLFAEDELVSSREHPLPERATLVSPNPSAGEFQFVWDEQQGQAASFRVYSGLGQLVRNGRISAGETIDLLGAAPGVYYLLVEVEDRVLTQRLMVR